MAKGDILSYKRNKAFPEAGMCLRRQRHAVPAVPVRKHTVAKVANPGWLREESEKEEPAGEGAAN